MVVVVVVGIGIVEVGVRRTAIGIMAVLEVVKLASWGLGWAVDRSRARGWALSRGRGGGGGGRVGQSVLVRRLRWLAGDVHGHVDGLAGNLLGALRVVVVCCGLLRR